MMRIISFLLILTVSLTQCEDKDCDAGYQCELSTGCKSYKVEREKLGRYQKDSSEFKKLLNKRIYIGQFFIVYRSEW